MSDFKTKVKRKIYGKKRKAKIWIFNKLFLPKNRVHNTEKPEWVSSIKECFSMIYDIGFDYDGYAFPENLMDLIDELVSYSERGLEIIKELGLKYVETYRDFYVVKYTADNSLYAIYLGGCINGYKCVKLHGDDYKMYHRELDYITNNPSEYKRIYLEGHSNISDCICGNHIENYYHGMYPERYFYACNKCKIQSKYATTLDEAVSNWNELICELSNIEYKGYKSRVQYSSEDKYFFGKIDGLSDLVSFSGKDIEEVVNSFHEAVDGYVEILESHRNKEVEKLIQNQCE